jgi:membrane-associated phospholipid phosphatase
MRHALRSALFATATFVASLLGPLEASASEPPLAARPGPVEWKPEWRRFSANEGVATIGLTVGSYLLERRLENPDHTLLPGAIPLLDDPVRWALRGRSAKAQIAFERISDLGYRGMALFPYVIDVGVLALGVHRSADVAAQMALIDAQSLTLAGVTQLLASRVLGRERPYEQDCRGPGSRTTSRDCQATADHKSFYSGHTAAAFTSAGLVCVHHQYLPLLGGGAPDAWACTWAVTVATATGFLRIGADAHWASDVIIGAGVGWLYGYVMPRFMHYDTPSARARRRAGGASATFGPLDERGHDPLRVLWTPTFTPVQDGGVIGITGTL